MKTTLRLLWLACLLATTHITYAGDRVRQQLLTLFDQGEQCYLADNYQQLQSCIDEYYTLFDRNEQQLGDSADVYEAYFNKMVGSFLYGLVEGKDRAYDRAVSFYQSCLRTFVRRNSTQRVLTVREELAQLYYKVGEYNQALGQLDTVFAYYDNYFHGEREYYRLLSQLAMCNARIGNYDKALSQINEAQRYFKQQKDAFYHETLRRQGKILMLQADRDARPYKEARKCYERYVNEEYATIAQRLDTMSTAHRAEYWLSIHRFLYDCYRLGNHAPEMLYDLALFSKGYLAADTRGQSQTSLPQVRWQQVRKNLSPSECAVEFVQYFGRDDEKRLGCLVLRNTGKPLFLDLLATDSLLRLPLTRNKTIGDAITSTLGAVKDTLYTDERLPRLIWAPQLMDAIGNAQKVFFAADGLLHQLAIEYIMPDTTKVCSRLSSTRLLAQKRTAPRLQSALLCGGIAYNTSYSSGIRDNDAVTYRFLAKGKTNITELPGARREVDSIYALRHHPQDKLLVGAAATDVAFLGMVSTGYDIIHLSTHGFFGGRIGIGNDIKPLIGDESMSKSGLIFAGASRTLADKTFDENYFDGILSATELAKQDFGQTELVVLSACQTGLGRLTDDGVSGLQRALKQAGAHAIIVSLWSVNDYSCSFLMRAFYEELERQTDKDIQAAFLAARRRLAKETLTVKKFNSVKFRVEEVTHKFNTPNHMNPFIIIDAY